MSAERRQELLGLLRTRGAPMTGSELAEQLGVSRQVIVQDIALLRAAGEALLATPRGYLVLPTSTRGERAVLATRHSREQTEEELTLLVDHGLRVLDVVVDHPLYGELRGQLMLSSRADVHAFLEQVESRQAALLSHLTGGVHLHTVEAPSAQALARAQAALRQRGYLLEHDDPATD